MVSPGSGSEWGLGPGSTSTEEVTVSALASRSVHPSGHSSLRAPRAFTAAKDELRGYLQRDVKPEASLIYVYFFELPCSFSKFRLLEQHFRAQVV